MQDTHTGNMVPLDVERFMREIPERKVAGDPFGHLDYAERRLEALQRAKDDALPKDRQGTVFEVGEELEIKGARFVVHSFGEKMMVLRGLPGTRINP